MKLIFSLLLIVFCLWPLSFLEAQALPDGLIIQPAKQEVFLSPGERYSGGVRVINNQEIDLLVEVQVEKLPIWESESIDYSPEEFISPLYQSFSIKAGQEFILPLEIYLPDSFPAGGYYGAVILSVAPLGQPLSTAKIVTRLGAVFLISFDGQDIEKRGEIIDFSVEEKRKVFFKSPEYFKILFRNDGNVHLNPAGRIEIFRFGKLIDEILIGIFPAYPGLDNSFQTNWHKANKFGFYQAQLKMYLDYDQEFQEEKIYFLVVPKILFIPVLLLLIAGLLLFLKVKFFNKI